MPWLVEYVEYPSIVGLFDRWIARLLKGQIDIDNILSIGTYRFKSFS